MRYRRVDQGGVIEWRAIVDDAPHIGMIWRQLINKTTDLFTARIVDEENLESWIVGAIEQIGHAGAQQLHLATGGQNDRHARWFSEVVANPPGTRVTTRLDVARNTTAL